MLRRGIVVLFLALVIWPAGAQTNVDRLEKRLSELTFSSIDDWKISPDLKQSGLLEAGDAPAAAAYDDAGWDRLQLRQRLVLDSCWMRKKIVLPQYVLGRPTAGPVKLRLTVDDGGELWINGQKKGRFDWDGEFRIADDAKPGDVFVIAIKAFNTGGPLRLLRAELEFPGQGALRKGIDDLVLSLRIGQKLLGFDTYQTSARNKADPGVDNSKIDPAERRRLNDLLQSLAAQVDADALAGGDARRFDASLSRVRDGLAPIAAFARRFTLFFDANAHIDAAWLWREQETVQVCRNTFSSVLNMFETRPDFTYTQSSAAYYDWMERLYPDLFGRIRESVAGGRWEVVGGTWIEPDCNLPSGESWARQLLYGKRYFRQKLGRDVTIGWNPDSFGYNWNLPQFYRNAGIDAFITQKIGWNATNVFPHRLFWWESPDGSRVLTYFPFDYVNSVENPHQLVDWLRQYEANTGFRKLMILFGVGDHGGGPSLEMLDRVDQLKKLAVFPSIEYGTAGAYLSWLKSQDLSKAPVWKDELYLEYHEGTFTTQARMKEWNRKNEVLLTNAEKFSTFAILAGRPYHGADLEEAWRNVMFDQFHDILPGSSIREVYVDAPERERQAQVIGRHELDESLAALAAIVDTSRSEKGTPLVVFNPLSWDRRGLVRLPLPEADDRDFAVFDDRGQEVLAQVTRTGKYAREIMFIAPDVPALGYSVFELRAQPPTRTSSGLSAAGTTIENQNLKVEVDPATGWLKSVFDKRRNREVLSGSGNELQLLEDRPAEWDAWNIGLTGTKYASTFRSAEIVERGPVRVVLRVTRDFLKPGVKKEFPTEDFPSSFFTQDIILYDGADQVGFATSVDWWEEKTMLKVAFPVAVADSRASYEIPFGSIERSTGAGTSWDKAKVEVPAQRWADLSQDDYGVSLLNNSKYGYDIKGSLIRMSLLRSPLWPDPTADRGRHRIEYALYPHAGRWRSAATVQRGLEFNAPLLVVETGRHPGWLPPRHSFVTLGPPNLVLTTIKKNEDSDAWVIQWYDAAGQDSTAELTLSKAPRSVVLSNFLEEDSAPVPFEGPVVKVPTGRNSIRTIKVQFAR